MNRGASARRLAPACFVPYAGVFSQVDVGTPGGLLGRVKRPDHRDEDRGEQPDREVQRDAHAQEVGEAVIP